MTQQQLQEIAAMPFGKRLILLNAKRAALNWTEEQYARVLRLVARVVAETAPQETAQNNVPTSDDVPGGSESVVPDSGHPTRTGEVTPQEFIAAFAPSASVGSTHHPDVSKGLSQKRRILNLLSDGQWHTNTEIMEKCAGPSRNSVRNFRYASRIDELRNEGYDIPDAEYVSPDVYRYRLIKKTPAFYGG